MNLEGSRSAEARTAELEAQLEAARKVIDALVRRAERQLESLTQGPEQFAVVKALSNLESVIEQRTRELYLSEARYRALYDHSPDMLFTVDEDGRITALNKTALDAFDCEEDAVVGCALATLFEEESGARIEAWAAHGFVGLGDAELALDDGRFVSVNAAPVPGLSGELQVVLRDVTARRRLESELGHARRLAAIGHLAAGVAHEINNPLTVMQLRLEMLDGIDVSPSVAAQLKVVSEHTHRVARIVRSLQSFAHPRSEERETVRVVDLVAAAREVAAAHIRHVVVRCDVPPSLAIRVDRVRAEQVLVNLLVNAGDMQSATGWIGVSARPCGDRVRIAVEDAGPGIPVDLVDHVFTPFVSGKSRRGSGLGLSIAWSIVKEHGGSITAHNRVQGGARFELTFPVAALESVPLAAVMAPSRPTRCLTVLVVDDERELLDLVNSFIAGAGHRAVGVSSAEDALAALSSNAGYDVILSDIRLPGMSGREFLKLLRRDRPDLARRTVLMSGFFHRPGAQVRYLQKPFGRKELLSILEEVAGPAAEVAR